MATQTRTPPSMQKGRYFSTTESPYFARGHKIKHYEVLFRHVFTPVYPHDQPHHPDDTSLAIPVNKLSHITHDREAARISSLGYYTFKPAQKMGKAYKWDGSPMGESFRDYFTSPGAKEVIVNQDKQSYKYVNDKESLMPDGYYLWWGIEINTDQWPKKSKDKLKELREQKSPPVSLYNYTPLYLRSPPESPYGNNEFSGELSKLLQCYQSSRHTAGKPKPPHAAGKPEPPDLYLLLGGTLRYKCEICYFVIVCTSEDKSKDALRSYKPVPKLNPQLHLNGLTNEDGKVIDFSKIPDFYPGHLSSNKSWANLAFAFYFEDNGHPLKCEKDKIGIKAIKHDHCVKTQPPSWVCPNNLSAALAKLAVK